MEKAHDLLRGDKIGQTQNFVKKGWIDREIKYDDSIGSTKLDWKSTQNGHHCFSGPIFGQNCGKTFRS